MSRFEPTVEGGYVVLLGSRLDPDAARDLGRALLFTADVAMRGVPEGCRVGHEFHAVELLPGGEDRLVGVRMYSPAADEGVDFAIMMTCVQHLAVAAAQAAGEDPVHILETMARLQRKNEILLENTGMTPLQGRN